MSLFDLRKVEETPGCCTALGFGLVPRHFPIARRGKITLRHVVRPDLFATDNWSDPPTGQVITIASIPEPTRFLEPTFGVPKMPLFEAPLEAALKL